MTFAPPHHLTIRHTVAPLAYRLRKAVMGAPETFAAFDGGGKTPAEILAHIGDLFDWALSLANGKQEWRVSTPRAWDEEIGRVFGAIRAFDERLANAPSLAEEPKLFQGPIADALTHTGQIAMLRRMAGAATKGENFFRADIETGRVGLDQIPPRREF
jgi:hypothetical protein